MFKKIYLCAGLIVILSTFVPAFAQSNTSFKLIPQPQTVKPLRGEFKLNLNTSLMATDETGRATAGAFNDLLMSRYGFKLQYLSSGKPTRNNMIVFAPQNETDGGRARESYSLDVTPSGVRITGDAAGQFYALQTLLQMLPVSWQGTAQIPAVQILDAPRFTYRGMHLDAGRHFMPVEFVKKYLDLMAQYKFNKFHWHLTEDQGWRIEIKKYPRLTEIGSRRPESAKERNLNPYIGDGVPVSGFYTQEQVKEVVAYAKARHITVIPEIELPGHSSAALAAYPNLGCKENYDYKVQTTWGIFKEVYCPKPETFEFLENVLTEVIALFPDSPYIHIGGDEVLQDFWKESAFVQELKQKENLKDEHEVQSYFVHRMERFINSKGKKIIGWDEILEGGLAPNATVMSWRGVKGGIEAARAHHDVIMTPTDFVYFDYGQGDPAFEPLNIGNFVPLEKVYSFEPVPAELNAEERKYILGGQGNVWTEYLKTPDKVEYMVVPRMLALAEVLWLQPEHKNYADFLTRLAAQLPRLDKQNVNYRIPEPRGLKNVVLTGEQDTATITLESSVEGGKIYYTTDGTLPNRNSRLYTAPLKLKLKPNETVQLNTIVVNAANRASVNYGAVITRRSPMSALPEPTDKKAGVKFAFYDKFFVSVNDLEKATPSETGETRSLGLAQFKEKTAKKMPFGLIFEGYLKVPQDGVYNFELEADDGAALWLDGEQIVNNDGIKEKQTRAGIAPLQAGYHRFKLKFFKGRGDQWALGLRWGIKGQGLARIYGGELAH